MYSDGSGPNSQQSYRFLWTPSPPPLRPTCQPRGGGGGGGGRLTAHDYAAAVRGTAAVKARGTDRPPFLKLLKNQQKIL